MSGHPAATVRTATRDDLDALVSLRPSVHDLHVTAHPEYFRPIAPEVARREAAAWLEREDAHVLLAEVGGDAVGYLIAYIAERPESAGVRARRVLYVDQIAVRQSRQGRGHRRSLFEAVRTLARRLGLTTIELEVWDFNEEARRFFIAEGFMPARHRLWQVLQ